MVERIVENRYQKGQLYLLPLQELHLDADQPRKYLDPQALNELAISIKKHGVLQPVLFRRNEAGEAILVAGERRVEAARIAELETIPAVFVQENHAEIALVENLLRQDLTAIEEAEALDRIIKVHGYKQEDLGKIIGKAQSTLSEILSLNRLPQVIRDECRSNRAISRRILTEIAKSKQQRSMLTLYKKYKERALSQDQIKKQARRQKKSTSEQAVSSINTFLLKLPALAIDRFTLEEKEVLISALTDLKAVIEKRLATLIIAMAQAEAPLTSRNTFSAT